ncbi:MAG: hypothetical protein HY729_15315 [Candidatus Rokubacteria bacterium]|nr:hypothetical protein [Candidatus Rokubacteria bacterium]
MTGVHQLVALALVAGAGGLVAGGLAAAPPAGAQPAKVPRIGVLWQTAPLPASHPLRATLLQGLRELGWEEGKTVAIEYRFGANQADRLAEQAAELVSVLVSPMLNANRKPLADLAARHRLPTVYFDDTFVESGGLMSYGASRREINRLVAGQIDKILKGAKPAALPVQQPTNFELTVNLGTARARGLKIPESIRARADRVIR